MKRSTDNHNSNQAGMVSLIVTMILMVVMSLIVLGFARITRHEQRQALDRQLSAQAYYAAESGINDAVRALTNSPSYEGYDVGGGNDGGTGNKTHCEPDPAGGVPPSPLGPGSNKVEDPANPIKSEYTCLLINQNPTSLVFKPVGEGQAISADVRFKRPSVPGDATAESIVISWSPDDGSPVSPPVAPVFFPNFPRRVVGITWNSNTAVARLQLTNFGSSPDDYSRINLDNSTLTAFLYPVTAGVGTINFSGLPANHGQIIAGNCAAICRVTINNVNTTHAFLRIGSIYRDSQITIQAYNTSSPEPLVMTGGQAVIDSTGKAQDVLRRIQVRLPLKAKSSPMNYALQATDGICKNFTIGPGFGVDSAPSICDFAP